MKVLTSPYVIIQKINEDGLCSLLTFTLFACFSEQGYIGIPGSMGKGKVLLYIIVTWLCSLPSRKFLCSLMDEWLFCGMQNSLVVLYPYER